ncbi:MAG: hypothetical protein ACQGVK_00770 [Myxococcota bacterium]
MRRWAGPLLLLLLCVPWRLGAADDGLDEARRLAASTRVDDLMRAAELFEARLERHPEDFAARVGAARALNAALTVRTHANLPLVDRLQDTPENRTLWRTQGTRALEHARRASEQRPESVAAAAELAKSFMYYASSLGIISSIVTGAGRAYLDHARRLVELDPDHDSGLGDFLLGAFFTVAPRPLGSPRRALEHYERAARRAPGSVRNQFSLGVYWARRDEAAKAAACFERAIAMPCVAGTETLICDWIKTEARESLAELAAAD